MPFTEGHLPSVKEVMDTTQEDYRALVAELEWFANAEPSRYQTLPELAQDLWRATIVVGEHLGHYSNINRQDPLVDLYLLEFVLVVADFLKTHTPDYDKMILTADNTAPSISLAFFQDCQKIGLPPKTAIEMDFSQGLVSLEHDLEMDEVVTYPLNLSIQDLPDILRLHLGLAVNSLVTYLKAAEDDLSVFL